MNRQPLNISLAIGIVSVVHLSIILLFRHDLFDVSGKVEVLLTSSKWIFTLACYFGLALGAMNFRNHKILSMTSVFLNMIGAILK